MRRFGILAAVSMSANGLDPTVINSFKYRNGKDIGGCVCLR
jgi:hypothetical protein